MKLAIVVHRSTVNQLTPFFDRSKSVPFFYRSRSVLFPFRCTHRTTTVLTVRNGECFGPYCTVGPAYCHSLHAHKIYENIRDILIRGGECTGNIWFGIWIINNIFDMILKLSVTVSSRSSGYSRTASSQIHSLSFTELWRLPMRASIFTLEAKKVYIHLSVQQNG